MSSSPRTSEKEPNAGRRLPRMGDARAEIEEPYPRAGQADIQGPVLNDVCLYWPLFYPAERATDGLAGSTRGPLFGFSLYVVLGW